MCCYACDIAATGTCDREHHVEGMKVPACDRHRDTAGFPCIYCGGATRKGSLHIDDAEFAHHRCHREAQA